MSFFDNFFNKCSCEGHQVYPATITPIMDGVGYVGSSDKYAREDHVHPSDTSKQDTLISGANIKTINGESLLGGGDLVVGGGGGTSYLATFTMTHVTTPMEADILTADKTWKSVKEAVLDGKTAFYKIPNLAQAYMDYDAITAYGDVTSADVYGTLDPITVMIESTPYDVASLNLPPNAQINTMYEFVPMFMDDDTASIQYVLVLK